MKTVERLLTIVVTATLTSAAWILVGSVYFERRPSGRPEPRETAAASPGVPGVAAATPFPETPMNLGAGDLMIPVAGIRSDQLSDTFSDSRGGGTRVHEALDIMAPRGTPVVAAAPGKVEKLFLSDEGGQTVYERSPDGRTIYYYAHLDSYAPGLKEGDELHRGDAIGAVGSTGNANPDGPHLHFAIMQTRPEAKWWDSATAVNPYPLLAGK